MTPKPLRGFALMTPEQRRLASAKGGSSVPAEKRGFALNKTLASEAGRKGGQVSKRKPLDRADG